MDVSFNSVPPVPEDVQSSVACDAVASPIVYELPSQIVAPKPALADGAGVMVRVLMEEASVHGGFPTAVRVRMTEPAAISSSLGV